MRTFQDLEALGTNENARMDFIPAAVYELKSSSYYKTARDAEEYYAKKNVTILKYQKWIMTATGQKVKDIWSSDYKLTHGFFRQFVLQQTQYVLSNGVSFEEPQTKASLGRDFDIQLQHLAKKSMVDGVAFGFWNYDHLEVFSLVETRNDPGFCPLYDEDTGNIRAGIRFWKPTKETDRWTLYEEDGFTEYIQREDEEMKVLREKSPYIQTITSTPDGSVEDIVGNNYDRLPIIPMYANDLQESELVGIRPSIDCYDFIMSGMANNIDETSAFYWTLEGTGAMDDVDLVNFVNKMKQLHAVVLDRGTEAEAHTVSVPVDANKLILDYLKDDMYENFMLMNPDKALSGNITATGIRLSYQQQDDKCSDFEYNIRAFIYKLFALIGIDDDPTFTWNRIANQSEETNMVLSAANYLDDETLLRHLPWLTPEEVDAVMERRYQMDEQKYVSALNAISGASGSKGQGEDAADSLVTTESGQPANPDVMTAEMSSPEETGE